MVVCALAAGLLMSGTPRNLLINGDFRHGRRGFATSYGLSDDLLGDGIYWIGNDPKLKHPGACSIHAHKPNRGAMLLLNGSATENLSFWSETIRVLPNRHYHFSGWATAWGKDPSRATPTDPSPARIYIRINGKILGDPYRVNPNSGEWGRFDFEWDSGSQTTAKIRLYDENTDVVGNDFAVDQLCFCEGVERDK